MATEQDMAMKQDERSGIALAIAGFATLSLGDAVIKTMAGDWPVVAVAALRFSFGALGLSALLFWREGARGFVPSNPWLQLARGATLALASLAFFSAIYVMPLAETMAITFVSPLLTALLSGPLLKERVRAATYAACLLALLGVGLILRPNFAELGWLAVLPLVSALFFSLTVICNRAAAGQGSALSMQAYVAVVAAPILILAAIAAKLSGLPQFDFGWPSLDVVARCAFVALTASTAHYLIFMGTMRAGAAQVAPASYVQMLVAVALGWWWFSDVPDLVTLAGASLIILAGLILWRLSAALAPR